MFTSLGIKGTKDKNVLKKNLWINVGRVLWNLFYHKLIMYVSIHSSSKIKSTEISKQAITLTFHFSFFNISLIMLEQFRYQNKMLKYKFMAELYFFYNTRQQKIKSSLTIECIYCLFLGGLPTRIISSAEYFIIFCLYQ